MVDVHKPAPLAAAVFALLALALLLFTTNPGLRPLQRDHTSSSLTSRSEAAFDQSLNSHAKRIALPFGHHDVATNFTSLPRSVQRATKLNYQYAACKGEKLWKQIQDAFDGQHPPGRQFGSNDFANGWTLTPVTGGLGGLPAGWDNAFRTFAGANNQVPNPNAISNLNLFQDQAFLNSQGNLVQVGWSGSRIEVTATDLSLGPNDGTLQPTVHPLVQRHGSKIRREPFVPCRPPATWPTASCRKHP